MIKNIILGIINQIFFTNALPTTTRSSDVAKDQCANKSNNKESRLREYSTKILDGTLKLLLTKSGSEFCSEVPTFHKHVIEFGKDADLCLPKPQAYVVNFAYNAFSESFKFLCKSDGQNLDSITTNR